MGKIFSLFRSFFVWLVGCESKMSFWEWIISQTVKKWRTFHLKEMVLFVLGCVLFLGGGLRLIELVIFCPIISKFGFFLQIFWIILGGYLVGLAYENNFLRMKILEAEEEKIEEEKEEKDKKFAAICAAIEIEN